VRLTRHSGKMPLGSRAITGVMSPLADDLNQRCPAKNKARNTVVDFGPRLLPAEHGVVMGMNSATEGRLSRAPQVLERLSPEKENRICAFGDGGCKECDQWL
jgi:hypothetical protein